ncbi:MAG: hypothetical protein AAFO29_10455 [Actinomycetota bacterium]
MGNRADQRWWLLAVGALLLAGCGGTTSDRTSSEGASDDGTELVAGSNADAGDEGDGDGASNLFGDSDSSDDDDDDADGEVNADADGTAESSDDPSSPTTSDGTSTTDETDGTDSDGGTDDTSTPVSTGDTTPVGDDGSVAPPTNVTATVDGPDIVIRWGPSATPGSDIEYMTHLRPIGETADFRRQHYRHRNHLRVDRISNPTHGTYEVDVWAVRVERDGDAVTTVAASDIVTRSVTVDDRNGIEIESLVVSDLLYNDLNDRWYLNLTLLVNKCVFVEVAGATTFRIPEFHRDTCLSEIRSELDPVDPGTHTITLTLTDRNGSSITETTTFTVSGTDREPCRLAADPPDPWRVKSGERATLDLSMTGDCGAIDWRFSDFAHPGFALEDGVLNATPTGPARGELIHIGVAPARSEAFGVSINVVVYTDEQPDVVPCTLEVDRSLVSNGRLILRVAVGATATTTIEAAGDCDPYSWGQSPASVAGVAFQGGVLTVTGEGPPRTEEFTISLNPENGTRWAMPVTVQIVE